LNDEALPSLDVLVQAGYPPATVYAYPFGRTAAGLDELVLEHVHRVRVSPGACPY
jgi:hypothetical protein